MSWTRLSLYLLGSDDTSNFWQEAIDDEMESLQFNGTWHLVDLPPGRKAIGCKWVLRKKLKHDGSVDKYKTRLIAKGFRQKEHRFP